MSNIRSKTVSGMFWGNVEKFSMQGVQFVLNIIMARLLSPHEFGLIAMLSVFMYISQVFIDGGFSTALIRSKNNSEIDFSTVFFINLAISIFFYILFFSFAPFIASFYNQPELCLITRVYTFNLIINSLVAINKVKLIIAVDFKTQSKISILAIVISGVIGIWVALYGFGVWALVIQMMLNAVLNVFFSFYYVRWFPKKAFSMNSFHRLFSFGSKLLGASLITSLYDQIYKLVIGKLFSSGQLGIYTQAEQLASFSSHNMSAVFQKVSLPILSQLQDNQDELLIYLRKIVKISAFIVFPLVMGMVGIAKPLIEVLLTAKWSGCVIYLQILSFAVLFDCVIAVNLNSLNAKGRSDLVLRLEVIKKTIAIIILLISLPWGVLGVCIGRVIYSLIAFYLNTYYTGKLFNYGFINQVKDISPYLALSVLMAILGLYITYSIDSSVIAFVSILLICPLFYLGLSSLFKLYSYLELLKIVSH